VRAGFGLVESRGRLWERGFRLYFIFRVFFLFIFYAKDIYACAYKLWFSRF